MTNECCKKEIYFWKVIFTFIRSLCFRRIMHFADRSTGVVCRFSTYFNEVFTCSDRDGSQNMFFMTTWFSVKTSLNLVARKAIDRISPCTLFCPSESLVADGCYQQHLRQNLKLVFCDLPNRLLKSGNATVHEFIGWVYLILKKQCFTYIVIIALQYISIILYSIFHFIFPAYRWDGIGRFCVTNASWMEDLRGL